MFTGRAVSDDFGITENNCERMPLAQTSPEGALPGNDAPENRDVQAGRPSSEEPQVTTRGGRAFDSDSVPIAIATENTAEGYETGP